MRTAAASCKRSRSQRRSASTRQSSGGRRRWPPHPHELHVPSALTRSHSHPILHTAECSPSNSPSHSPSSLTSPLPSFYLNLESYFVEHNTVLSIFHSLVITFYALHASSRFARSSHQLTPSFPFLFPTDISAHSMRCFHCDILFFRYTRTSLIITVQTSIADEIVGTKKQMALHSHFGLAEALNNIPTIHTYSYT